MTLRSFGALRAPQDDDAWGGIPTAADPDASDVGNDGGYRVVVVRVWVGIHLNPHPLTPEGAAPKCRTERIDLSDLERSGLRPCIHRKLIVNCEGGICQSE